MENDCASAIEQVSAPIPADDAKPWHALAMNLVSGLRAVFFLRVPLDRIHATWSQLILLTAVNVAIQFVSDFARVGPAGEFASYGLPGVLFTLPVVLFAAWALARLANRPEQTLLVAVAFSAISLPIKVLYTVMQSALGTGLLRSFHAWNSYLFYPALLWFALAAAVTSIRLFGMPMRQRAFAIVLAIVVIGGPFSQVYRDQTLWVLPYDENAAMDRQRDALDSEDIFYLQPKLLERELAAVKPNRKDGIALYFVGAAGYAEQDVFMKEVHYVSDLFKKRFGTEGHSVMLINNPHTVAHSPIASATSLRLALKRVGEVMNRDRDILFLYLTSHGSKDHKLSLSFGAMQFNDLDPKRLRAMLDESGIKRRVVIVSACYSGGFVDALKNENSLVITASAPDKNSFGCSNEAEFTYFGKAYFDEALRKTDSFIDAFNLAKPIIAAREKIDDYDSSDPRIFIGANIRQPLAEFASQWAPRERTRGTAPKPVLPE
jgi:hypothetical protein